MTDKPRNFDLILASGSTARVELLGRLGLPFERIPADIDETPLAGETPVVLVERLSREKAAAVAARRPGALVIGSDQAAVFEGEILGKPGTAERARAQLRRFSGREVVFLTGVSLRGLDAGIDDYVLDETTVRFRDLDDDEIDRYVAREDPVHCAGAFKVEALGPVLFEEVRSSDPTGLVGLPLIALARLLRRQGLALP